MTSNQKNKHYDNLQDFWYPLCQSNQLNDKPLGRMLFGNPIVLFRNKEGIAAALYDVCPHRNAPLSCGKVTSEGNLECPYHGWRFNSKGVCVDIPGYPECGKEPLNPVSTFHVIEQQNLIWVYGRVTSVMPTKRPYFLPGFYQDNTLNGCNENVMDGNYNELIDNFTDSMHPHFVHKGVLYDDSKRQPLNFDVHRLISKEGNEVIGLEATSYNEKIDMGNFIFNMISPKENVTHHERYFVPIIHQVEYSIANIYIFVTFILTPENENRTRVFQVYSLKSKCPKWITGPIIKRVLNKLLVQDKYMLELQADNIRNIGGRHFYYTKIDMLSFHTKIFLHHLELGNSLEDIKYQDKQYDVLI